MITINLIPERQQLNRLRLRYALRWGTAWIGAGLLFLIPLSTEWRGRDRVDQLREINNRLVSDIARLQRELQARTNEMKELDTRIRHAQSLRAKHAWSRLLVLVGRQLPPGCWLSSMATDPERLRSAVRSPPGRRGGGSGLRAGGRRPEPEAIVRESPRRLRLAGYAVEPSEPYQFAARLKLTDVFSNVWLEGMHREAHLDGNYYRFDLVCEW